MAELSYLVSSWLLLKARIQPGFRGSAWAQRPAQPPTGGSGHSPYSELTTAEMSECGMRPNRREERGPGPPCKEETSQIPASEQR